MRRPFMGRCRRAAPGPPRTLHQMSPAVFLNGLHHRSKPQEIDQILRRDNGKTMTGTDKREFRE